MWDPMKCLGVIFALINILNALNNEILIIVSYDAFRNEYFNRNVTNYSNELRWNNTRAEYIRNVFPTKTFPNHHSIATGVFPQQHGVMANTLYDNNLQRELNYSFELFHFRSEIKPIWILNEMSGGHSGCMMWPGSDYEYDDIACTHSRHYNPSENYRDRVDEIISWILDDEKPANLVMFYIEEPDTHSHAFGPESKTITDLVEKLNNVTEYLHQRLEEKKLLNRVSVVHLSDHGMDSLQLLNVIDLTKIIGNETVKFYGTTPVLQIVPKSPAEIGSIYQKLLKASETNGHFKVYINSTLPKRWHFNNNYRVGPITVVADLKYGFQDMYKAAQYYKEAYDIPVTPTTKYGVHGYDNIIESMHPIFFAYGHLIKTNNTVEPFDTVDLFYLFCEIINLQPPSYLEGNRQHILSILKDSHTRRFSRLLILTGSLFASITLVTTLMLGVAYIRRYRSNFVPNYLYEEDTILDDTKMPVSYSINSSYPTQTTGVLPSTSFEVA